MPDIVREIIYPTFVIVLIASVWALGWDKSQNDEIERAYAPSIIQSKWMGSAHGDASDDADTVDAPTDDTLIGDAAAVAPHSADPVTSTHYPGD